MRRQVVDPNQLDILSYEPAVEVLHSEPEIVELPEGAAVSLKTRAEELLFALHHIGVTRTLGGLSQASEWNSRHRPELEGRYGGYVLERIALAGGSKAVRSEREGRNAFRRAMGTDALIAAGVEDPAQVELGTEDAYREFVARYFSGEAAQVNRGRFRRVLTKQLEHGYGTQSSRPA